MKPGCNVISMKKTIPTQANGTMLRKHAKGVIEDLQKKDDFDEISIHFTIDLSSFLGVKNT